MGTALTERQAQLLQRFAGGVVLAMDADAAGMAANRRGTEVLRDIQAVATAVEQRGRAQSSQARRALDIRVLALPGGKDPDELIRNDPASWEAAVRTARPVIEHLLAVVSAGLDLDQPRHRSQLVSEVLPAIGEVADPVIRAHYIQRLSRMARVGEEELRRQLPRTARRQGNARNARAAAEYAIPAEREAAPALAARMRRPGEEFCLALLYRAPWLVKLGEALDESLFSLSENRELYRRWRAKLAIDEEEIELWEHLNTVLATRIPLLERVDVDQMAAGVTEIDASETASEAAQVDIRELEETFSDCVARLERVRMRAVKEASALALADGEAGVRPGQVASIARNRLEAGTSEDAEADEQAEDLASRLLQDMEAGLAFHRRLIEGSRSDRSGSSSE
jgi:DNA primase